MRNNHVTLLQPNPQKSLRIHFKIYCMQKCPICQYTEKVNQFPLKYLIVIVLFSFVATAGLMVLLGTINETLTSAEPGYDIIDFELAFTQEKAGEILETWGLELQEEARKSLYIDFAYLLAYALFLSSLTLLVTRSVNGTIQRTGMVTARMPVAAALLDIAENVLLLHVINTSALSGAAVMSAGVCAVIKFVLVGIVVVFCIVVGTYGLISVLSKRTSR